jgi:hypothetical protein
MASATIVTVVARDPETGAPRCKNFQLTTESTVQRQDLRDLVGLKAFEEAETVDHGVPFSLESFLSITATHERQLKALFQSQQQLMFAAIGEIREFVEGDIAAQAFVSVE